jgi:uncharacterized protein (DUF697 family)
MTDIIAEDSKLLFVGKNSDFPRIEHWQYKKFGCGIGWRGDECILFARSADLPHSEYNDFREYCIGLELMYEDVIVPPENRIEAHAQVVMDFLGKQDAKTVYSAQYSTLIYEFIGNYVDKFIDASDYVAETPGETPPTLETILNDIKTSPRLANLTMTQSMLCHAIIHPIAAACAVVAFVPIPVADTIPITGAQVSMVIGLAKVFDNKISSSDAQVLLKTLAAPLAGRALAKNALIFLPGVGWGINGAIAGIITEILGWAVANDFAAKANFHSV